MNTPISNDVLNDIANNCRRIADNIDRGVATPNDTQYLVSVADTIDLAVFNHKNR